MDLDLVTIIQGLGVITTAIAGIAASTLKIKKIKNTAVRATEELDMHAQALSFNFFFEVFDEMNKDLINLMERTNVDRFIILKAWNGSHEPEYTNSVYQFRLGGYQKPIQYAHYKLDVDYQNRLKEINELGHVIFKSVDIIGPSKVKESYDHEGVQVSAWFHIGNEPVTIGRKAINYCSFGKTVDEDLTREEFYLCLRIAERLREAMREFNQKYKDI